MALLLEDGTGIVNAEAYVDIAYVDNYATKFGKDDWVPRQTVEKEIHIRRATRFIDNKYPFPGTPKTGTQGLFFPAEELTIRGHSVTGVPVQLKDAVAELSILSASGIDLVDSVAARAYTYRKIAMEGMEKTERFESENTENQFRSVELLLQPILSGVVDNGIRYIKMRRA